MVDMIRADVTTTLPQTPPVIVFLGDLIDRGPGSRECLDAVLKLAAEGWSDTVCIRGNHEQSFLQFAEEGTGGAAWCAHGGYSTLASYGVNLPQEALSDEQWALARQHVLEKVPDAHWGLLRAMPLWATCGDYLFVHAGVRPNVPLNEQEKADLLWIRQPFLKARRANERVVVHGHTVLTAPEIKPWRIGVDTGAYITGVLTAVRLQGHARDLLQT